MLADDAFIAHLRSIAKQVTNPRARETEKERHRERTYQVAGGGEAFTLFVRQSTLETRSFSAGLQWHAPDGARLMLARYNGADHPHLNPIEGNRVDFTCHIHQATERYIAAGRKPEHFAAETTRYSDSQGALRCLLLDWNITGLDVSPQEQLPL